MPKDYGNILKIGDKAKYSADCHYAKGGIETIEVILAKTRDLTGPEGFLVGNVLKYMMRYPYKGSAVEDLEKARWYDNRLLQWYEENPQYIPTGEEETK